MYLNISDSKIELDQSVLLNVENIKLVYVILIINSAVHSTFLVCGFQCYMTLSTHIIVIFFFLINSCLLYRQYFSPIRTTNPVPFVYYWGNFGEVFNLTNRRIFENHHI